MKICPKCHQTYADLNYCTNDGEFLVETLADDVPPTVFMDPVRSTNPNLWQPTGQTPAVRQNQNYYPQPQSYQPPSMMVGQPPPAGQSRDQILPTISLVLGSLSVILSCCLGGVWLGIPAAIVGYLGMKNADSDPSRYGGRNLAIAGMVLGLVALLLSIGTLILGR